MDEPVDVVDEHNTFLYKTTKHAAHQTGELHRCVVGEIFDSQGRWLLVKQASDRQDAGQFVSPIGGHVTAGESAGDAIKREAQEETGLRNFPCKLKGRTVFNRDVIGRRENHLFILYEIQSDEPLVLNHEAVEYRAFTEEELKRMLQTQPKLFGDSFFYVLQKFYPHML